MAYNKKYRAEQEKSRGQVESGQSTQATEPTKPLSKMNKAELVEVAEGLGIDAGQYKNNKELTAAIKKEQKKK